MSATLRRTGNLSGGPGFESSFMPSRLELYSWRFSTGVAFALAGWLALRGGGTGPGQTTPPPVGSSARERAPERRYPSFVSGAPSGAKAEPETLEQRLTALKSARSPSETCGALSSLANENGDDERAVTSIADFATATHSMLLRSCSISALGSASSEAATSFLIALAEDPEISIRLYVVDALAGRKDAGARGALLDAAHSEDHELAVRAALALAQAGAPEAVPFLVQALRTESGDIGMGLIAALGTTKTPEAATALVELVKTGTGRFRTAAISALGEIGGEVATQALASALGGSDDDSRAVVQALAQIGDERARKVLLDVAVGGGHEASIAALRGLSGMTGDDVKRVMTASLASTDPERAASAAMYFGQQGDASTLPALTEMTRRAGPEAAQSALTAIASIGGEPARAALASLARQGGSLQGQAMAQLAALPGGRAEARNVAFEIVRSGGTGIAMAFDTLAGDGSKEARDALIQVARGGSGVAVQAMHALARDGDAAAIGALASIAGSAKNPADQISAMSALAATGSQNATPALLAATSSADPSIRVQALAGLSQLGGPDAERAFMNASRDKDASVANGALQYLARAKTPQALGRLEEVALGTNAELSQQALGALASAAPARAASLAERLLQSTDASARASATRVAATLPSDQAERLLTAAARDADPNVVREAIGNLQYIGGPTAHGILLDILKREGAAPDLRSTAAQVLNQLGGSAVEENATLIQKLMSFPSAEGSE